ncbi:LPXTG cell wall anchor domain-containing protein [Paenilisteria rocourtiae]|nr:LPXTG cell wall anchor domain-containing protein [Listeria rocourtiae]MBC1606157.1 LPXTG cell wall anchor domain-containing protein [Listeria rocourtiae]
MGLAEERISDADKNECLPKTGHKSDIYLLFFGILLIVSALFFSCGKEGVIRIRPFRE